MSDLDDLPPRNRTHHVWSINTLYIPPEPPGGYPKRDALEWYERALHMYSNLKIVGACDTRYAFWSSAAADSWRQAVILLLKGS